MRALSLLLVLTLAGCTLPQTTVRSGSSPPQLVVRGAPSGSVLYVDGQEMGPADHYNGSPTVLVVLEGVHKVEIRQGGESLFSDKVFVATGETHAVTVVAGHDK